MNILITYTTVSGNTEIVCQTVCRHLEALQITPTLKRCEVTTQDDINNHEVIIFASPTYAHGELQEYFGQFLDRIKDTKLINKKCAVIGLGDNKYDSDYLIESARIIKDFIEQHHGELVLAPLEVVKSPLPQLSTKVKTWAQQLAAKIK